MKKTYRILSLIMALVMIFALGTTTFAADVGTATIDTTKRRRSTSTSTI